MSDKEILNEPALSDKSLSTKAVEQSVSSQEASSQSDELESVTSTYNFKYWKYTEEYSPYNSLVDYVISFTEDLYLSLREYKRSQNIDDFFQSINREELRAVMQQALVFKRHEDLGDVDYDSLSLEHISLLILNDQNIRDLFTQQLLRINEEDQMTFSAFETAVNLYLVVQLNLKEDPFNTQLKNYLQIIYTILQLYEINPPQVLQDDSLSGVGHKYEIRMLGEVGASADIFSLIAAFGAILETLAGTAVAPGPGTVAGGVAGGTAAFWSDLLNDIDAGITFRALMIDYNTVGLDINGNPDESIDPAYEYSWRILVFLPVLSVSYSVGLHAPLPIKPHIQFHLGAIRDLMSDIEFTTDPSIAESVQNLPDGSTTFLSEIYYPQSFFGNFMYFKGDILTLSHSLPLLADMSISAYSGEWYARYKVGATPFPFELETMFYQDGVAESNFSFSTASLEDYLIAELDIFNVEFAPAIIKLLPIDREIGGFGDITATELELSYEKDRDLLTLIGFKTNEYALYPDDLETINNLMLSMISILKNNLDSNIIFDVMFIGSYSKIGNTNYNKFLAQDRALNVLNAFITNLNSPIIKAVCEEHGIEDFSERIIINSLKVLDPDSGKPSFDNSAIDRVAYIWVKTILSD